MNEYTIKVEHEKFIPMLTLNSSFIIRRSIVLDIDTIKTIALIEANNSKVKNVFKISSPSSASADAVLDNDNNTINKI